MRDAGAFADVFGCVVRAPREAAARLEGDLEFEPYDDGEELAPGVTWLQIGRLAPTRARFTSRSPRARSCSPTR
jgi:hypothetical protein